MTGADLVANIKKQPVGFACGFVCLVCAGWLYFRSGTAEELQTQLEAKSAEANTFVSNVSLSKNLPEQVAEIQAVTKELESRLVKAGQLAVNLQYFYKLEADNEVKLSDLRQNDRARAAKPGYFGVAYTLNVQGPYKNIMTFLERLEKGRHFCRINNATFSKAAGNTDGAGATMTLALGVELFGQP